MSLMALLRRTKPRPLLLSRPFSSSDYETDSDSDHPLPPTPTPSLPTLLHLISTVRSQSQSHALNTLKSSPDIKPSPELACAALWALRRDSESSILAFRWAGDSVTESPRAWHLLIWSLAKQRRFDVAWGVVRRMHKRSKVTPRAFVIMMQRYAAANEVEKAVKTFYAMERFNVYVKKELFYALLRALCKNKNVEEAEELLLKNRKFFPLEAEGFNVVLYGWCSVVVDLSEAKRVWREMSICCITPDGTSYAYLISCFSKAGNLFHCLRLYDEMKKKGWTPNLVIYKSLVYVLTRENCLKDAYNIFDKIIEAGLDPNVETYNSMIDPLCEARKLQEAWKLVAVMIQKGIYPDVETYNAFAKAEDIGGTLQLLRRMRETCCGPTGYTFLLIFDNFFKLNKPQSVLRMWTEMRRYDLIPDSSHYMKLVQGLMAQGWMPKALEIYREMRSKGFPSDPKIEKLFKSFFLRK